MSEDASRADAINGGPMCKWERSSLETSCCTLQARVGWLYPDCYSKRDPTCLGQSVTRKSKLVPHNVHRFQLAQGGI